MKTSEVRINDIAQIITGKTPPTVIKEYFGNKYPFITPSDIPTFRERRLRGVERYLSDKGFSYQKKMLIPPNSPCFVAIGSTVGKMCLTNKDSFTNQQIHSLITQKGKADPFYLFYHLSYIYPWIKSIADARGSGKAIINKTDFGKIKINIPPLPIQKKIAAVLSAYDDLIENNNRRIAILEKMAEEIYREWFVRMRFPGHEKVKFDKGMPEGWRVKRIGDICLKITDGSHYSPKYYADGKPMASVKDMSNHGFSIENIKTISERDFKRLKKSDCMPMRNDVLIAKDGSYLKHVFVWNYDMEIVILSSIAILRPNKKMITPHFLALTLKQGATKSMMSGYVSGSALPRIILNDFAKMKLLVPSIRVLNEFENITNSIFVYINVLILKNSNLKKSRDLLFSRLLSGKLSVENLDIKFPPGMKEADA